MQKLKEAIEIIGIKRILLAALAFLVGNFLLYFLVIYPFKSIEVKETERLGQLTETYIQMHSVDYPRLISALSTEDRILGHKVELLENAYLPEEAVPHYVSNLERAAVAAGLEIESNLHRAVPTKRSRNKKHESELTLTLNLNGSYAQIISFLRKLESWPGPVFVKSFALYRSKRASRPIKGVLNCPILEKKGS